MQRIRQRKMQFLIAPNKKIVIDRLSPIIVETDAKKLHWHKKIALYKRGTKKLKSSASIIARNALLIFCIIAKNRSSFLYYRDLLFWLLFSCSPTCY